MTNCLLSYHRAPCRLTLQGVFVCKNPSAKAVGKAKAEVRTKAKAESFLFCIQAFKRAISLYGLAAQALSDVRIGA